MVLNNPLSPHLWQRNDPCRNNPRCDRNLVQPGGAKERKILCEKHTVFALASQRENYINQPGLT